MDPSAMDFHLQHHRPPPPPSDRSSSSPMALDQQHLSSCPALRGAAAAAEQNHHPGVHSPSRSGGGSYYDPVHGSSSGGNWWQPPHPPHNGWQHPQYPHQLARSMLPHMYPPPYPHMPGPTPPSQGTQTHYSSFQSMQQDHYNPHPHPHPHNHTHSPPPFHHRPTIPSLNRLGGTASVQHNQGGMGGMGGSDSHVPRTGGLPALHPIPPIGHASQNLPIPSGSISNMDPTSPTRSGRTGQARRTSEAENSQAASRPSIATVSSSPHGAIDQPGGTFASSDVRRTLSGATPINRRPRVPTSTSEPSSDDDESDSNDPDVSALRLLESISASSDYFPAISGPEAGIRASQLMRGATSGRRVASRSAIASLQSVKISDLPESERTCIICYNEFGTETPEGINEAPLRLPKCKHVFGDHCIKKWFEESDSCPYCRDKVPSESQYRSHHPQAVLQFIRHHQMHAQRQARADPNGSTPIGSAYSAFAEFYGDPNGLATPPYRRADGLPTLRTSAWHGYSERRSPSSELNEGRRRTRARHGSLRGSPPSARPNSYAASTTIGQPQSPFSSAGGRSYASNHNHRHSVASPPAPSRLADTPSFEPSISSLYPGPARPVFHTPISADQFANPLNSGPPNSDSDPFRPNWPQMRSQFVPPVSAAFGGQDVHMAFSDELAPSHNASQ